MASGDIKGFYRQKKKDSATKSSSSKKKSRRYTGGASVGASSAQTPTLVAYGSLDLKDDHMDEEEQLRQFDMDMNFGPCIGVTRLQRWERASTMGLHPPPHIRDLLLCLPSSTTHHNNGSPSIECLWEGRV